MTTTPPFTSLLHNLNVRSLGDGCVDAGTDTYVSMCATLAALAHPASCLAAPGGQTLPVGLNTLTASAMSAALLRERVLEPLRIFQNQHVQNTIARAAMKVRDAPKGADGRVIAPVAKLGDAYQLLDDPRQFLPSTKLGLNFADRHPSQIVVEASTQTGFYFVERDRVRLGKHLESSHLLHPLVRVDITNVRDVSSARMVVDAITDGSSLGSECPVITRGHIVATLSLALLRPMIKDNSDGRALMERMLWLTGTPLAGVDYSSSAPVAASTNCAQKAFQRIMNEVLVMRLQELPIRLEVSHETLESCFKFMRELRGLESRLSGISASLRSLVPTLIFGTALFYGRHQKPGPVPGMADEVFISLARALAMRMVETREVILDEERLEWTRSWATKFCQHLLQKPHTARELCRRANKLRIGPCLEILTSLETAGMVQQVDEHWLLIVGRDDIDNRLTRLAPYPHGSLR